MWISMTLQLPLPIWGSQAMIQICTAPHRCRRFAQPCCATPVNLCLALLPVQDVDLHEAAAGALCPSGAYGYTNALHCILCRAVS